MLQTVPDRVKSVEPVAYDFTVLQNASFCDMGLVTGVLSYLDLLSGSVIMTTLSLASETASGDRLR